MKTITILFIISLFIVCPFTNLAIGKGKLVTYKHPGIPQGEYYKVWLNNNKVEVLQTRVAEFVNFSFEGPLEVKILSKTKIETVDIRPKNQHVIPKTNGDTISFTLQSPAKLSIEINQHLRRPLFFFANPIEKRAPSPTDPNVLYFKSGKVHQIGSVHVKSGQTVYIEGGAVIEGSFKIIDANNVNILGRGIIYGANFSIINPDYGIGIVNSSNILIDGPTLVGCPKWNVAPFASTDVMIRNVKIIDWRNNDDGIDIVGCENLVVDDCFVRTKDDCIVIKATHYGVYDFDTYKHAEPNIGAKTVKNIVVKNSVIWNADWGNAIEIGWETRADSVHQIKFENNDIIRVEGFGGVFSLHHGNHAVLRNIVYKDIRIEDARGFLADFRILNFDYGTDTTRGNASYIYFENIEASGDIFPNSIIAGFNEKYQFRNIFFKDIYIKGRKINSAFEANLHIEYAENIHFQ